MNSTIKLFKKAITFSRGLPGASRIFGLKARWADPVYRKRAFVARQYIRGDGIEIGALHEKLPILAQARVRYVDRMSVEDLRSQYPELRDLNLVHVDVVDSGETLSKFEDQSTDFVIANHFLEHCEDPIRAVRNMYRVLRSNGVLYLSIPDKRFTFDKARPLTTLDHLLRDHQDGPSGSRRAHFEEYVQYCEDLADLKQRAARVEDLLKQNYSIHYHVWTQQELAELILHLRKELGFEIELTLKNNHEFICILRKP